MSLHIANIKPVDISNGPGVRVSVFVSGCSIHCKGCFNKIAWDFDYGNELTDETIDYIKDCLSKPFIKGLTIIGGEPLDPKNVKEVNALVKKLDTDKPIWLYTGYTKSHLKRRLEPELKELVNKCECIVYGPFIESMADPSLAFRGSSNQVIWENPKL